MNLPVFEAGLVLHRKAFGNKHLSLFCVAGTDVRAQQKTDKNMYVHTGGIQEQAVMTQCCFLRGRPQFCGQRGLHTGDVIALYVYNAAMEK